MLLAVLSIVVLLGIPNDCFACVCFRVYCNHVFHVRLLAQCIVRFVFLFVLFIFLPVIFPPLYIYSARIRSSVQPATFPFANYLLLQDPAVAVETMIHRHLTPIVMMSFVLLLLQLVACRLEIPPTKIAILW